MTNDVAKWVLALALLTLVIWSLLAWGARRWAARAQALAGRLDTARQPLNAQPKRYETQELTGLPTPVQRYFRAVLTEGQAMVATATIEMAGRFNLSATGERWKPFTSRQAVVTQRPGFVWDARVAMMPGVAVRVVDSYIAGQGLLRAAVLGWFTMADVQGDGEIARGEFMRYFAESPWYPTALLPSQGVRWQAVDDRSANATLTDGPLTLTLLFRFNNEGLISSFRAEARGAMDGKTLVMTPWEGQWSNYQVRRGMRVPLTGEVAWMRPEGRRSYFVGGVTSLRYEFAG
jgi:hypothetical protein